MTPRAKEALRELVERMRVDTRRFYWALFGARYGSDHHAFLEFNGLISKYVDLCERALLNGIDFRETNVHVGKALPMESHDARYLGEKFACIFGPSLRANPKAMRAFLSELEG